MRKKPFTTMLATAVLTAAAALSVPMTSSDRSAQKRRREPKLTNSLYIVQLPSARWSRYRRQHQRLPGDPARQGPEDRPAQPEGHGYKAYLDSRHDAVLASVGGGRNLQLRLRLQWFRSRLPAAPGRKASRKPGVMARFKRRGALHRYIIDAGVPRPERARRILVPDERQSQRQPDHRERSEQRRRR